LCGHAVEVRRGAVGADAQIEAPQPNDS
jgi:hypothetical protein